MSDPVVIAAMLFPTIVTVVSIICYTVWRVWHDDNQRYAEVGEYKVKP